MKSTGNNLALNLGASLIAIVVLIPIFVVVSHLPFMQMDIFIHLKNTLLPKYITGSALLVCGVVSLTLFVGVSSAYLISFYRFSFCKIFEWALILPLAIPAYIMGFIYVNIFEFRGVYSKIFGGNGIDIMNLAGGIVILSLSLYPYVYFFSKNTFAKNMGNLLDAGYALGASRSRVFFRVILPYSRIAIIGSVSLVIMETLSEYGLVSYFGIDTFSTGIFRTFLGFGDASSAMALSAVLVLFVLLLLAFEGYERKKRSYVQYCFKPIQKTQLKGVFNLLAFTWCLVVFLISFGIPLVWLLYWSFYDTNSTRFLMALKNSFFISIASGALIVFIGLYLSFSSRLMDSRFSKVILTLASLGYAIPGAVVALGILIFFGFLNKGFVYFSLDFVISGGIASLMMGYCIRFLATSLYPIKGGYSKIKPTIDQATFSLKRSPSALFGKIHIPLLSNTLFLAFIVVVIDIYKELPITMILSPFGFEALSVLAYEYATNEQIYDAALPSLLIVALGLIPAWLLHYLRRDDE